jgi:uncharacterized protein (TIGR00106 family)
VVCDTAGSNAGWYIKPDENGARAVRTVTRTSGRECDRFERESTHPRTETPGSATRQRLRGADRTATVTVIALLSVAPVVEDSMADEVAKAVAALDEAGVAYETNPMGTVIETEDVGTLFEAVEAAHEAVDGDRVSTFLKIDDKRTTDQRAFEKVDAVEAELGHAATSERNRDAE